MLVRMMIHPFSIQQKFTESGPISGTGKAAENNTDKNLYLCEATFYWRETDVNR